MKILLKQALNKLGQNKNKPPAPRPRENSPPLEFLDGFLTGLLSAHGSLGLLQCGANDGVTVDPVRQFILRHPDKVNAVLVEPLPDIHDLLRKNYNGHGHVKTLNLAIGPQESIELYRIKPEYAAQYKGIIASGITSFDREFVLRKAASQLKVEGVAPENRIECLSQRCETVSQLIDTHKGFLGDALFLQIDAEGFDDEVVYTVDFDRHRPLAINYEQENLSKAKHEKLKRHLARHGYRFVQWNHSDELAIRS